jgi:tripartite-type tricarboxylate transporter receptor subunit TctC
MTQFTCMAAAAALAALALGAHSGPADADDKGGAEFFRGRTVTYIVSTTPGGGHDFYGRLAARHMERFLPGSTFIVKNVPGAGHLIGANTIYGSKPDGLTIGTFSTGITVSQIIGKEGIRFDLKKMSWIGKGATDTRVLLISDKAGFKDFDDLRKSKREIKLSTAGVGTGAYNETLIVGRAFDLPFKVMLGYSGSERAMGMMRGEVDGVIGGESSVAELGGMAGGRFFLAFGDVANTPNARDYVTNETQRKVIDLIEGQGVIYRLCAGPPDIPADRLSALRTAFMSAYGSPELQKEAGKRPVTPLGGEEVSKMITAVIDQPPEIIELLKGLTWTE